MNKTENQYEIYNFLSAKCVSVSLAILGLLLSAIACDDKEYGDAMSEGQLMNDIEMNIESSIALAVGMDIQVTCKPVPENVTYPRCLGNHQMRI